MSNTPFHFMVTMHDKTGGPEQAFWINSHSEHSAGVRALRICGPGYTVLSVEALPMKKIGPFHPKQPVTHRQLGSEHSMHGVNSMDVGK